MPLKASEVESLLKVLSPELTENQTLETIANTFHSFLPTVDSFQVCTALNFMVTNLDDYTQPGSRRLVSEFLIYECYKNQPITRNPFVSVLLNLYTPQNSDQLKGTQKELHEKEKQFIQSLLLDESPKKDLVKLTPKQILHSDVVQTEILDPLRNKLGSKAIEISRSQFERNLPDRCKNVAIAAVLPHPDEKSYITHDSSENVQHMLKELLSDPDHPLEQNFTPELITPNPPIHFSDTDFYFCFPSELKRMHLLWDTTSGVGERQADGSNAPNEPISPELELRILVDKSLRSPLTLKQQHALTTHLAESPTRVLDAGLTPQAFPDLVEHSPMLAIEVLRALIRTDRFTEYLTVLVNMEMSVHSMEVVKLLTAEVDLPTDLIVLYLCNCMSTCEQNKDQYTQNRLVRLFCVFLQSLVKNNTIHLEDISIELQCFCIQFCAFKEVSALYRMLKNKGKPEDVPSTSGQLSLDCAAKDSNSSNSNLSSPSS